MHNERQLKRSKSENFKIAAKPLLQYMRTWGPFVAYMAGLVVAVAMAAVPAVASLQNAPTLFSSWASANIADRVQVQLYTCGLIMFVIQSHLIMFQTMFRWRQASDRLQSAEIVRKQTPAVAGFYIGCAIALLSGLLPMPAHGEPVLEVRNLSLRMCSRLNVTSPGLNVTCQAFADCLASAGTNDHSRFCQLN